MRKAGRSGPNAGGGDAHAATGLPAECVLDMLQVRSSDALPIWLADELFRRFQPSRARVLRVFPGAAARSRDMPRYALFSVGDSLLQSEPHLVGVDAMIAEVIRTSQPWSMTRSEGGSRLLCTLSMGEEVRYVVELSGQYDPGDGRFVAALATLASRYFERLMDAETDPLTRLANRRAFQVQLDMGLRRWTASGKPWYFAMLDIDHFKRVNDNFGHLYGDEILVVFANLLRATFRSGDLPYRFGGEEFVLLFGVERPAHAQHTLERFRAAVEHHAFPGVGRITVSIGYTRIPDATTPATTLIDRADQALYYAKGAGRNQVCGWEALLEQGKVRSNVGKADITLF